MLWSILFDLHSVVNWLLYNTDSTCNSISKVDFYCNRLSYICGPKAQEINSYKLNLYDNFLQYMYSTAQ